MFHSNLHMIISCCILSDPSGIDVQGGGEGKRGSCPRILELCNRYQFSASEREMFHLMVVVQGSCDAHVLVRHFSVRSYGLFCLVLLCAPTPTMTLISLLYSPYPSPMSTYLIRLPSLYYVRVVSDQLFTLSTHSRTHTCLFCLSLSPTFSFILSAYLCFSLCLNSLCQSLPDFATSSSRILSTFFCTSFLNRFATPEHSRGRGLFAPHQRVPATVGHERGWH
jgi:hypothetical protein